VFVSEDDDDYDSHGGMLSSLMTTGYLLDPIPACEAVYAYEPVRFRVQLEVPRDWPTCTAAEAVARRMDLLVASEVPEVVATTRTKLLESPDGAPIYECSGPLVRGGYGTGRAKDWSLVGHAAGTAVGRLDGHVFRYPLHPRMMGQTLWFKLAAQNEYADPEAIEELAGVDPVSHMVSGVFYQRDPRRFL
jgi:hypothetical protein